VSSLLSRNTERILKKGATRTPEHFHNYFPQQLPKDSADQLNGLFLSQNRFPAIANTHFPNKNKRPQQLSLSFFFLIFIDRP
jgi:hypothetical protein